MSKNNYPTVEKLLKDPQGSLDRMYNRGVEDSIKTVQNVMKIPHDATDNFAFYQKVIKELSKLKSNE